MFKNLGSISNHGPEHSVRLGASADIGMGPMFALMDPIALTAELAALRSSLDLLAARFRDRYRSDPEVAERTEQVSAAIQRLEWALARHQRAAMCAGSGSR